MFKKFLIYFLATSLFVLCNNALYANNEENEKDEKIIKEVSAKTGFNIEDFYSIKENTKIKIYVSVLSKGYGCLPKDQYPSEEKRKQIYNTPTIYIEVQLLPGLAIRMQLAHFPDEKDTKLGFYEIFGMDENRVSKTLFSGETIENALLYVTKFPCVAHMIYKNCVLNMSFLKNGTQNCSNEDFEKIDDIIKLVKVIIDKSIK